MKTSPDIPRRQWLAGAAAVATSTSALASTPARAKTDTPNEPAAQHKIVYQINRAESDYHEAIFNSIGALITKYVDDVQIAVVVWGPGIHLLARQPRRPVPDHLRQRVRSLALSYGVRFIACGNTMHTVGWEKSDMLDFATIEDVGAAAVMELQEKGYAYLVW